MIWRSPNSRGILPDLATAALICLYLCPCSAPSAPIMALSGRPAGSPSARKGWRMRVLSAPVDTTAMKCILGVASSHTLNYFLMKDIKTIYIHFFSMLSRINGIINLNKRIIKFWYENPWCTPFQFRWNSFLVPKYCVFPPALSLSSSSSPWKRFVSLCEV